MAKVAITEQYLTDIADAIRSKTGMSSATYYPSEMAPAIMTISGSGGITPSGTININTNGTHNVTTYASANVSVPNSYSNSDEGKVVSSGALVAQSSATYTENGTYDTTLKNSVTVDVEGGSGTEVVSVVDTTDIAGGTIRTITAIEVAGTKNITDNGTYDVTSFASADVSVPASAVDSGTKSISTNGTHDVIGYASANVAVPNSYSASDEGKVVSSGALVAQTAHADVTPTTSDQTIDTTTNNSIKVKGDADLVAGNIKKDVEIFGVTGSYEGGGGGYSIDDFVSGAVPSGTFTIGGTTIRRAALTYATNITSVTIDSTVTSIGNDAFSYSSLQYLYNNSQKYANYMVRGCASLKELHCPYWPSTGGVGGYGLQNCSSIELIDFGLSNGITANNMPSCPLHTLIVRKTGSCATLTANTLNNSTAFQNGGTGGTVYVPNDLIASYKTATNWATYYGYGTMVFKAIEGSIYEL